MPLASLPETITRELHNGMRALRASPGFTAVVLLTLALGIGATSAVFAVVNGVLLRPLPYEEPDRLIGLWHAAPGLGFDKIEQSQGTYTLYKAENRTFENIGLYQTGAANLDLGDRPERAGTAWITASLLPVLRVSPILGRGISEADDRPGAPPVMLISEALWRRSFGGDRSVLGKTVRVNDEQREIIGVMPASFRYPENDISLWIPQQIDPARVVAYSFNSDAVGRLKPGVTIDAAQRDLQRLMEMMPDRYPGLLTHEGLKQGRFHVMLHPMRDDVVGEIAPLLWVVMGTAVVILLIGCANVANLFLVRAEGRQREMAVRTAIGAERSDLVGHALGESLALAIGGGLLGALLATIGVRLLVAHGPDALPRLAEISVDARVLACTVLASLVAGLVFSILPVIRYASISLNTLLKEGSRGGTAGRERNRARQVLVVTQVALALVLLAGAGLMVRTFTSLQSVRPGFEAAHVLTFRISLPARSYASDSARARFYTELLERIGGVPGIQAGGLTSKLPLEFDGHNSSPVYVEGMPLAPGTIPPVMELGSASDGYFRAMGIRLLEGRDFDARDRTRPSDGVVVSHALAEHYWPGQSAIGKRVRQRPYGPWYSVIGIVDDVRGAGLDKPPEQFVYFPVIGIAGDTTLGVDDRMTVTLRTVGEPQGALEAVRREVRAMDPGLPLYNVQPMTAIVRAATARTAFTVVLLGIASVIAVLLGAIGIYGVISYVVSLRSREIGVRMALGAQGGEVRWMVTRQGLLLAGGGIAIGLVGAALVTRLLRALLFGVTPGDPVALIGSATILLIVAAVASAVPAWRASRLDPISALRAE
jgi:predicted permease